MSWNKFIEFQIFQTAAIKSNAWTLKNPPSSMRLLFWCLTWWHLAESSIFTRSLPVQSLWTLPFCSKPQSATPSAFIIIIIIAVVVSSSASSFGLQTLLGGRTSSNFQASPKIPSNIYPSFVLVQRSEPAGSLCFLHPVTTDLDRLNFHLLHVSVPVQHFWCFSFLQTNISLWIKLAWFAFSHLPFLKSDWMMVCSSVWLLLVVLRQAPFNHFSWPHDLSHPVQTKRSNTTHTHFLLLSVLQDYALMINKRVLQMDSIGQGLRFWQMSWICVKLLHCNPASLRQLHLLACIWNNQELQMTIMMPTWVVSFFLTTRSAECVQCCICLMFRWHFTWSRPRWGSIITFHVFTFFLFVPQWRSFPGDINLLSD